MAEWWKPSPAEQIKRLPWIHKDAIAYLESILRPDFRVMEHGAGGSTLWFSDRVAEVVAFEDDPDWQREIQRNAGENVRVLSPAVFHAFEGYQSGYDLLMIDGLPTQKAAWMTAAREIVRPGGWVVLDNANRPEHPAEREAMKEWADLVITINRNTAGTLYFVTDFWRARESRNESTTGGEDQEG